MAVIDVITYNGEEELFEIRYNVLKDYVDEFRVVEFDKTFSGKPKEKLFNTEKYDQLNPRGKVFHYWVPESSWSKYKGLALSSPNTEYGKGAEHWIREFCQKESIKDCLTDLDDDDEVFIGDCDEIWEPGIIGTRGKLRLRVYSYYLNNRSNEDFYGTIVYPYKYIKGECLNHLRSNSAKDDHWNGWHFTSMGGYEKVKQKLTDSYTSDSYANSEVLGNLHGNITDIHDFLGRDFTYRRDEEGWPKYLKDNKDKYKHLLMT